MATFNATQISQLVRIFQIDVNTVTDVLFYHEPSISDEMKTDALDLIAEYFNGTTSRDTAKFYPLTTNKGFNDDPVRLRNLIKRELASLLFLTDLVYQNGVVRA